MKRIAKRLEELFIEITFAEERSFSSVREALRLASQDIENTFTAVAFAEEGEFETAERSIHKDGENPRYRQARRTVKRFTKPCTGRI